MKLNKKIGSLILAGLLLVLVVFLFPSLESEPAPPAATPEPVREAYWIRAFGSQQKLLEGHLDVCLVGDSLTQYWVAEGRPILDLQFRNLNVANLGIAADRTENILYRIQHLDFDSAKPDVFVLLAGTNNLAKTPPDSPEDTAAGIKAILDAMEKKSPRSEVVLISILPNGNDPESELRKDIQKTNELISQFASSRVHYIDVHDRFLKEDGTWKSNLTVDKTHLSVHGYDILGIELIKTIDAILREKRD